MKGSDFDYHPIVQLVQATEPLVPRRSGVRLALAGHRRSALRIIGERGRERVIGRYNRRAVVHLPGNFFQGAAPP